MTLPSRTSLNQCIQAVALAIGLVTSAAALDHGNDVRIVPQVMVGTSGFEPGLALEWRGPANPDVILRPELLISEDGRLGVGGALLLVLDRHLELPARQAIAIGPRVVYHNADDNGWEADVLATWSYELSGDVRAWRHAVGALAALGVVRDRDDHEFDPGASAGVFYSFGF